MSKTFYICGAFVAFVFLTLVGSLSVGSVSADAAAGPVNLLENGSFEAGTYASKNLPDSWHHQAFKPSADFLWHNDVAYLGEKSIQITSTEANDAQWYQTVAVDPHTNYLLSGWIKTEDVAHSTQSVDAGANLCLDGTWTHTEGLIGTNDWTNVSMVINSGDNTELTICARLGYWSGTTTGTAWFDQLKLFELEPTGTKLSWKILVLIYEHTDFTYTDGSGVKHRVITAMTDSEIQQAAQRAQLFVEEDIPALTSGNMVPELTIRYPARTISGLSPYSTNGWWLSPQDTAQERDPDFDAVLAIWNPKGTDIKTGSFEDLSGGQYAGLTPPMGAGQTYALIISDAATWYPHRNVFKHEFGHSILSYFDAVGTAPKPTVSNHANSTDYVNCLTGEFYVWIDETEGNPIPNSIYNNESGFTHDYYSGTTATRDQPSRCLGITPSAWSAGGPITKPIVLAFETAASPEDQNGEAGSTVTFRLQVTNVGNSSDSYQLSYSGNQWPVSAPTMIGPLAADTALTVPVTVNIPSEAKGLAEDNVTLTITSQADGKLHEIKTLTTTASIERGVELVPDNSQAAGIPGTTVDHTLSIKNTSNVSDSFSLSIGETKWTYDFPGMVGPVAPGESQEIEVSVTIDPEAAQGETDTAILTVFSQADASISASGHVTTSASWLLEFLPVVSKP